MRRILSIIALSAALALPSTASLAAGSSSSSDSRDASDKLSKAESMIQSGDHRGAIPLLEDVVAADGDNANAYNYLGFAYRNLGEYDKSKKYYDRALSIDPDHKGAREYLGELYLKLGKLSDAQAQLARLDEICSFGCPEYDDLERAIEDYQQSQ